MKRVPSHRPWNPISLAFFTLLTTGVIVMASAAHVKPAATMRPAMALSPDAPGAGYFPRSPSGTHRRPGSRLSRRR